MSEQCFCLRWNNYQSSVVGVLRSLLEEGQFVDVTLACDGRRLKAHKLMLSACSNFFRELLKVCILPHLLKNNLTPCSVQCLCNVDGLLVFRDCLWCSWSTTSAPKIAWLIKVCLASHRQRTVAFDILQAFVTSEI